MCWRADVNLARAHLLRLQGVMELIDAFARLQCVVLLPCLQRLHGCAFVFISAVLACVRALAPDAAPESRETSNNSECSAPMRTGALGAPTFLATNLNVFPERHTPAHVLTTTLNVARSACEHLRTLGNFLACKFLACARGSHASSVPHLHFLLELPHSRN